MTAFKIAGVDIFPNSLPRLTDIGILVRYFSLLLMKILVVGDMEVRYSVRKFEDRPLAEADVEKIIRAGILAPTACNFQPERIMVIKSDEALTKLRKCTSCDFGTRTSFLICYDKTE